MIIKYNDQQIELPSGSTGKDLAEKLNLRNPNQSLALKVNGNLRDLSSPLCDGESVSLVNFEEAEGKEIFWHTSAHVLAQAIIRLWPNAKPTIGPPIEAGFYYDFADLVVSDADFEKIEKEVEKIINENLQPQRRVFKDKKEALQHFAQNPYKKELIESFEEGTITGYGQGEFFDLCRGPHLPNLGKIKAFKVLKTSGAYWKGDSKREMLTRVYAISYPDRKQLKEYLLLLEEAKKRGLDLTRFTRPFTFDMGCHNDFFEEIAKFRAARRLWARVMKEKFKVADPRAQMLRFHTQTAGSSLTAQQPDVNLVRTTIQALSAILGGTQSLHTNAKDEALGLPTEQAALLALRTQQIIAYESGAANTVDPLGGSYFIETLTGEIETRARQYLDHIEALGGPGGRGGMLRAIETGFVQREIQQAAFRYQQAVERGEQIVVGVNRFEQDRQQLPPVLRVDPVLEREQVERLHRLRAERQATRVSESLQRIEQAARGSENLMPHLLDAVEAYTTVGEISDALRRVFGEYKEAVVI